MKIRKRSNEWYGWRPDMPDARDYKFKAPFAARRRALPPKIDLSTVFGDAWPCFNQGELGSCTSNAIGGALLFDQLNQGLAGPFIPSRLFVYYNERVIEGTIHEDAGAEIRDGIKSVATLGAPPETPPSLVARKKATRFSSCWPYVVDKFDVKPGAACYRRAAAHPALRYERLDQTDEALQSCLASGMPFVFGFTVYEDFESDRVDKTGVVNMPKRGEAVLGGHAVLAVGYDEPTGRYLCRNSWDIDWGMAPTGMTTRGYFTIPYEYLSNDNLSSDFWVVRQVK